MSSTFARTVAALALFAALGLAACASHGLQPLAAARLGPMRPYTVDGQRYEPRAYDHYDEKGLASWYSYPPRTRRTADGEWFDASALTAAHKTLPLPCTVEVTNLENGRKVLVRVNDRGPFVSGRIIDLSRAAAERLGIIGEGTARVRVRLVDAAASSGEVEIATAAPDPLGGLRGEE